jgi:glycosyltransferase involved in cell wall biosynthesis
MVGISLLTLVPGEVGGSEIYVQGLLRGLRETGSHEYRVLLPPAAPEAAAGLPSVVAPYRLARTPVERVAAMGFATARPKRLRTLLADAEVVHYPLTIRIPSGLEPSVVTLHDVQHLDLPELFSRAELAFRRTVWHPSIHGADRVIVLSDFVRRRAVERLGLDERRIRVVPSGIDHAELTPGGTREPFLLYPARRWPHKNHEKLLAAFAILRRSRPELRLVLTGGGATGSVPEGVEDLGLVPRERLVELLQSTAALVFPSLYEGFGLPVLEAMACGCPVACSDAGSLPEVAGGAARLFDPHDPEAIAAAVADVLADPSPWVERGLARAALFSWEQTAQATDAVYTELSTRS